MKRSFTVGPWHSELSRRTLPATRERTASTSEVRQTWSEPVTSAGTVQRRPSGAVVRRFPATALSEQFVLQGEIDAANAPDIGRDLLAFVDGIDDAHVELDCRGLRFIDSSGLRMLIGVQETGGLPLALIGLPASTRRIFTLTALDQVFELR
jgi:anti-anti-sigma factor